MPTMTSNSNAFRAIPKKEAQHEREPTGRASPPSRTVTFGSVEVNEHAMTLGANPAVSDGGPPIELEWESQSFEVISVDGFEQSRRRHHPTTHKLDATYRRGILFRAGFSEGDLQRVVDEISSIRLKREMSKLCSLRSSSAGVSNGKTLTPKPAARKNKRAYHTLMRSFSLASRSA